MVHGARTAILGERERLAPRRTPYFGSCVSTARFFATKSSPPIDRCRWHRRHRPALFSIRLSTVGPHRGLFRVATVAVDAIRWRCSFWLPSTDRARSVNPGRAPQVEKAFDRDAPHRRHEQRMDATAAAADKKGGERNANRRDAPSPRRKARVRPHSQPN